jgi:hypothetical protein
MFAIRVYLAVMTAAFLVSALLTNRFGILAALVGGCSLVYLILDTREELHRLKVLETEVSAFLDGNSSSLS